MFKPKLYLLLSLTFFAGRAFAQNVGKFYEALSGESSHYNRYDSNRVEILMQQDSLIIDDMRSAAELQLFINKGGQNKIYAVDINSVSQQDMVIIINLLSRCPNLQYLKLSNTDKQLPAEMANLQQVLAIEFASTNYIDMAEALKNVSELKNLQRLVFTDYKSALPSILSSITQVTTVNLTTLNIKGLELGKTNWQSAYVKEVPLDPYNNELAMLALSKVRSLRNLNLEFVKLRDTAVIGKFTQLTNLQVSGWNFKATELVNKIGGLVQLKSLSLELPLDSTYAFDGLKPLNNLIDLAIYTPLRNKQRMLNAMGVIAGFKNLESLTLSGYFTTLPDVFDKLPKLKRLSLKYNALTTLPIGIFKLPNLESLDVSSNDLTELPYSDKYESNSLKTINLKDNFITNLPPAITKLNLLANINVGGNKLIALPDGWENLTRLKYADFSDNELTAYPPGLQNNHSVENISLFLNKISYIRDVSGSDYHLRSLSISNNALMVLPEHIGRYNNLMVLEVSNNKLISLPASLGDCKKLQRLELRNTFTNNVKLPLGLKDAIDLSVIDLSYNPQLNNSTIFDIILSGPRKHIDVRLRNCGLDKLPATSKWATTPFWHLDLSGNKLVNLPIEFRDVKAVRGVELGDNPFPGNPRVYYLQAKTKGDMQVLFKEINTRLPNATVPKADRVIALLNFAHNSYYQAKYTDALQYAMQALVIDIDTYNRNANFNEIGICRFKLKDYKGAMLDFDKYINQTEKSYRTDEIWGYKAQIYMLLK
jgi:Leucine-rich repeat (LRR) protein